MSAETSLKFFRDQYGIIYPGGKIFAEKLQGNYRIYHWDVALQRLDVEKIRQQLGVGPVDHLDNEALEQLAGMDIAPFVAQTVLGKVGSEEAASAHVMEKAEQMGIVRVHAGFLRDAIDLSCQGFEFVKYTEDGVMLSFDDFEELTPPQLDTFMHKLDGHGAIRYRRHEIDKNQYIVRFRRDLIQYDIEAAPVFFDAFTF